MNENFECHSSFKSPYTVTRRVSNVRQRPCVTPDPSPFTRRLKHDTQYHTQSIMACSCPTFSVSVNASLPCVQPLGRPHSVCSGEEIGAGDSVVRSVATAAAATQNYDLTHSKMTTNIHLHSPTRTHTCIKYLYISITHTHLSLKHNTRASTNLQAHTHT